MIVLQILGWLVVGLIGLLLLLLVLLCGVKLSVRVGYCDSPLLIVGIGPFHLNLTDKSVLPEEEKPKPTTQKPPKKQKKPKKAKQKEQKPPKLSEKPSLPEIITAFKELACGILSRFARHLKVEEFRLRVLVASDDAAKTAMEYGAVCSAAHSIESFVTAAKRKRAGKILVQVECDFLAEKPEIDAELCLSVRIWRLLVIALFAAKPLYEAVGLLKAYRYFKKNPKGSTIHGNSNETAD